MKYIRHIKIERVKRPGIINWLVRKVLPNKATIRIEMKGGVHKYARCPLNCYVKTEKVVDVYMVYPWDVLTCKVVRLHGVPRHGPELVIRRGRLMLSHQKVTPNINNHKLKINVK